VWRLRGTVAATRARRRRARATRGKKTISLYGDERKNEIVKNGFIRRPGPVGWWRRRGPGLVLPKGGPVLNIIRL